MNADQIKFFNEVIRPKLIEMAIDCTLPSDMNEIHWAHFEEEAKQFNKDNERSVALKKAEDILFWGSTDSLSVEEQVKLIESHDTDSDIIEWIDGVEVVQSFETSFTVKTFLQHIGL